MTGGAVDAKAWLAGVFDRAAPTYDAVAGAYHASMRADGGIPLRLEALVAVGRVPDS